MILLLHGALGASSQLIPLHDQLAAQGIPVQLADFPGHGQAEENPEHFSIRHFAESVVKQMDLLGQEKINILGYSMGGYVGLYLCRHYPERVNKLMTLATKLDWNPEGAAREVKMLNPEIIEQKVPQFAAELNARHRYDWKQVLHKTAAMMLEMGEQPPVMEDDFPAIVHPVLMAVGDRDKMVSVEETLSRYRKLGSGRCWVIPSTGHPVESMPVAWIAAAAVQFFEG